jgi:hypothetical protein
MQTLKQTQEKARITKEQIDNDYAQKSESSYLDSMRKSDQSYETTW